MVLLVDDISIVGEFYLPDNNGKYPAVCICHGIPAGSAHDPGDGGYPLLAETVCQQGFAVLIFNFRGAGESGGNMDIKGWSRDLTAAVNYLTGRENVDAQKILLMGFSAGGAVSIYNAAQDERISGVVSCASPAYFDFSIFSEFSTNGPQTVVDRFRETGIIRDADFPVSLTEWFHEFDEVTPVHWVGRIAPRPLLLLQGSDDVTVPVSHAQQLYDKAQKPKQLIIIDGASHRLRLNQQAMDVALEWLQAHRK